MIEAETFITRGSSGVSGCGLLAFAPGDAVDSPRWRSGNVSWVGPDLLQAATTSPTASICMIFIRPDTAKHVPDRDSARALGESRETYAATRFRRCYAVKVLKKIFAGLAGALALIVVPPTGEAERQIPIVLDLSPSPPAQNGWAAGEDVAAPIPVALVWPLYTM